MRQAARPVKSPQRSLKFHALMAATAFTAFLAACMNQYPGSVYSYSDIHDADQDMPREGVVTSHRALRHDLSEPLLEAAHDPDFLREVADADDPDKDDPDRDADPDSDPDFALSPNGGRGTSVQETDPAKAEYNLHGVPKGGADVEQTVMGAKPAADLLQSFDGLGATFPFPAGATRTRISGNPSDNALAVGPNHIVQIVNSQIAVYTKKGEKYDNTGTVLFGPVNTNAVFRDFGDPARVNSGDAVVRYDQLADRWLIVLPIFSRLPARAVEPPAPPADGHAHLSVPAVATQPAATLQAQAPGAAGRGRGAVPPASEPTTTAAATDTSPATATGSATTTGRGRGRGAGGAQGSYAMCYAVSATSDPLGAYYRYEFIRPLFPDYPRPAVWLDGYYVPTSTGDTVIQKQAFVADRAKMLKGEDATEQGFIIDGVNFLNNADIDGKQLPPPGSPNIMMAAGGHQLRLTQRGGTVLEPILEDDGIYTWKYHVDWSDPSKSKLEGPTKITVAPYHYMCGGQLTAGVPQPGAQRGLDSQGDKIMQRLVYRRIGDQESILAVHSINATAPGVPAGTSAGAGGAGGVRWYEFRLDSDRNVKLYQQGTYCPGGFYRWMASPEMDSLGNIALGYSFGGTPNFPGQRFAARNPGDPLGQMTLRETVLAEGEASQTATNRWQDYTTSCMDPSDDRTIWYVGDYLKTGNNSYSTRIGAFKIPAAQ